MDVQMIGAAGRVYMAARLMAVVRAQDALVELLAAVEGRDRSQDRSR